MLIRFVVQNFLSFKDETEFNMLPAENAKHPAHLRLINDHIKVLPLAAIYGANASGKTNLMTAMNFARDMLIKGPEEKHQNLERPIFRLHPGMHDLPTQFEFEFVAQGRPYGFGISFDDEQILEEWLYALDSEAEELLFKRSHKVFEFGPRFGAEERLWLENEGRGTPANQSFLRECARRDVPFFEEPYQWFLDLTFVYPTSSPRRMEERLTKDASFRGFLNDSLRIADLGINELDLHETSVDVGLLEEIEKVFRTNPKANNLAVDGSDGKRLWFSRNEENGLTVKKLVLLHRGLTEEVAFDLGQESDGTRRILELAPAFMSAMEQGRVFVFDELERSLHPLLSKRLIEMFLACQGPEAKGQIIFTTHNTELLTPDLLREDEIWFVEKGKAGQTKLCPASDFKNFPPDLRAGYLLGRFGAVPLLNPNLIVEDGQLHATEK